MSGFVLIGWYRDEDHNYDASVLADCDTWEEALQAEREESAAKDEDIEYFSRLFSVGSPDWCSEVYAWWERLEIVDADKWYSSPD